MDIQQDIIVDPRSLLQPGDVKGYPPNTRQVFKEYPKALQPPAVEIKNANEERQIRAKWGRPLPWLENPERASIDAYYNQQAYPKLMDPPHVEVKSAEEEAAVLATWDREPAANSAASASYPKMLFHPTLPAQMVRSREDELRLGPGWFDTIADAIAVAMQAAQMAAVVAHPIPQPAGPPNPATMSRDDMFAFLKANNIPAKIPQSNDQLRDAVRTALATQRTAA